ncbi:unnamed protein product [Penicillium crustosum]
MAHFSGMLARSIHFLSSSRPSIPDFKSLWCRKLEAMSFVRLGTTKVEKSWVKYDWIEGVEVLEEYQLEGYHPITVGDVLHNRCQITDKLGFGGYSTVWIARDTYLNRYVTLNISVANSIQHETKVLKALSASTPSTSSEHPGRGLMNSKCKVPMENIHATRWFLPNATLERPLLAIFSLWRLREPSHIDSHRPLLIYIHKAMFMEFPSSFDDLSIRQFYERFGEPETVPITRRDGEPLSPNAPTKAVVPLFIGKYAEEFSSSDAHPLLIDFGEAFSLALETRLGKDCHTPNAFRAPEAKFERQMPLGYPSDIWSLATAI